MMTPAQAKAKLAQKISDDETREAKEKRDALETCRRFFETDEEFRDYAEEKVEDGINRAIEADGNPLYVLVYDGDGTKDANFQNARLSWIDENWEFCEANNATTTCIDVSEIDINCQHLAGNISCAVEEHLKALGWKTVRCDEDLHGHVSLYLGFGAAPRYGSYSAFRLCYEG